jgi:ABC-2 type transport system permease protein
MSMLNVWLIAKREYLERVRAKSFLIMTILIPLLMGGLVYGAALAN